MKIHLYPSPAVRALEAQERREAVNATYSAAHAADTAFSVALRKQFGPKASRWDFAKSQYNGDTLAAYKAKVAADNAHQEAWVASRVEA